MRRRGTVWKRGDGQYVARLRVGGLSFYGPTRPTRLEAEKDIPELVGRVDNGEGQTLLDYATEYLQGPYGDSITGATKSRAESTLKILARDPIGSKSISSITIDDLQAFVNRLKSAYAPSSVRRDWAFVSKVVNNAVSSGIAERLPLRIKVRLPVVVQRNNVVLPMDVVREVVDSPSDEFEHMLRVILMTGMRRGEVCRLKWEHLDENNRTVFIPGTKTTGSAQKLPVPDQVVESIKAQPVINEYVFTGATGCRYEPWELTRKFVSWRDRKGLDCRIRLHDLRGTFATILIRNGVDIKTVQALMRHATPEMTLKVYVQYDGNGLEAVNNAFGKVLSEAKN